jgi:hypothetical protein
MKPYTPVVPPNLNINDQARVIVENEGWTKEWTTKAGLQACWLRNPHVGSLAGYVAVLRDNSYCGYGYDDLDVTVHGGLTYSNEGSVLGQWWFGFDCAHAGDLLLFHGDLRPEGASYKDARYVEEQCERLAEQLIVPMRPNRRLRLEIQRSIRLLEGDHTAEADDAVIWDIRRLLDWYKSKPPE